MTARLVFTLIVGMGLACSATLVGAQGAPPPPPQMGGGRGGGRPPMDPAQMKKMMAERKARHIALLKKLHLSASQMHKIKDFDDHQERQMMAAMKSKQRPDRKKMREERDHVYGKVMSAKQFKMYQDEMQKERAKMGGGRRGGPGGPGGPGGMRRA